MNLAFITSPNSVQFPPSIVSRVSYLFRIAAYIFGDTIEPVSLHHGSDQTASNGLLCIRSDVLPTETEGCLLQECCQASRMAIPACSQGMHRQWTAHELVRSSLAYHCQLFRSLCTQNLACADPVPEIRMTVGSIIACSLLHTDCQVW